MTPQTVLITGASARVGKYLAQQLAAQGLRVLTVCRTDPAKLGDLTAVGIEIIQADLSTDEGIEACIAEAADRCGSLRALVHNASLWFSDDEAAGDRNIMESMMKIHITAPYRMNFGLRHLLARDGIGDIIHITDSLVHGHTRRHIAYGAAKAAMEHMVRSFASLFGPEIKVNSIAPGIIKFRDSDSETLRRNLLSSSVFKKPLGEHAVWEALSYILNSDTATGTCLHVDGGKGLSLR